MFMGLPSRVYDYGCDGIPRNTRFVVDVVLCDLPRRCNVRCGCFVRLGERC